MQQGRNLPYLVWCWSTQSCMCAVDVSWHVSVSGAYGETAACRLGCASAPVHWVNMESTAWRGSPNPQHTGSWAGHSRLFIPQGHKNRFVRVCLFYSSNYERLIGNVYCWETNWECLLFTYLFVGWFLVGFLLFFFFFFYYSCISAPCL